MAVAAASVLTSGAAVAGNHGTKVSSALGDAMISGEAYGAYRSMSTDTGSGDSDDSDFDLDELRLGVSGDVGEDTMWSVELGFIPGDNFSDSGSSTTDTTGTPGVKSGT
ncbi:MAG: hypothetical protein WBN40_01590, partial [Pseudomonadales bacterium]